MAPFDWLCFAMSFTALLLLQFVRCSTQEDLITSNECWNQMGLILKQVGGEGGWSIKQMSVLQTVCASPRQVVIQKEQIFFL